MVVVVAVDGVLPRGFQVDRAAAVRREARAGQVSVDKAMPAA